MTVAIVIGSGGLVGSKASMFFVDIGFEVVGIDNDMRRHFFGPSGSTCWQSRLLAKVSGKDSFTKPLMLERKTQLNRYFGGILRTSHWLYIALLILTKRSNHSRYEEGRI